MNGFPLRWQRYLDAINGKGDPALRSIFSLRRGWLANVSDLDDEAQSTFYSTGRRMVEASVRRPDLEEAITLGQQLIDLAPGKPHGYAESAAMLLTAGDIDRAGEILAESLEEFPESVDLLSLAGHHAFLEDDLALAEERFSEARASATGSRRFETGWHAEVTAAIRNSDSATAMLDRQLSEIAPVELMELERDFSSALGETEVAAAWDDLIARFGSLSAPAPEPPKPPSEEGGLTVELIGSPE